MLVRNSGVQLAFKKNNEFSCMVLILYLQTPVLVINISFNCCYCVRSFNYTKEWRTKIYRFLYSMLAECFFFNCNSELERSANWTGKLNIIYCATVWKENNARWKYCSTLHMHWTTVGVTGLSRKTWFSPSTTIQVVFPNIQWWRPLLQWWKKISIVVS